jgi:hypothetical protein
MKLKFITFPSLIILASLIFACSTATPTMITATLVPTETPFVLDLSICKLDNYRLTVGTWSALEMDDYIVGVLPFSLKVNREDRDSFSMEMTIWCKTAGTSQFPPLPIGKHGG